jgi:SpoVK/Ycf46/Vps4 family AAA+-type ATPase
MNDSRDLQVLIESHIPLISIETREEQRAFQLIERLAVRKAWPLFTWSVTEGIRRHDSRRDGIPDTTDPEKAMRHIEATPQNGVFVLFDFHPYLENPVIVRLIKSTAQGYSRTARTLIFVSHKVPLPPELQSASASFELALPGTDAVRNLLKEEADMWTRRNPGTKIKAEREAYELLVQHLAGMSLEDARRLIRHAIQDDDAITMSDIERVLKIKQQKLGQEKLLEVELDVAKLADIGGLSNLKRWLAVRREVFLSDAANLPPPKGILLLGVQGGGKSLAARAVAGAWGLPLLRLDFGTLYNKFYGETERNLREALKTAEAMAPCVLWMDEVEKGVASDKSDDGVSRRVLGTLLTWLAERKSKVFVVATANDISILPPELLRKGRLDEIFFVDLPDASSRGEVFAIHLKRRGQTLEAFDLNRLAQAADGFSGAEIEQAVVAALYQAHTAKRLLTQDDLLAEMRLTKPLSVVMAEKMAELRTWAAGRTVMAN